MSRCGFLKHQLLVYYKLQVTGNETSIFLKNVYGYPMGTRTLNTVKLITSCNPECHALSLSVCQTVRVFGCNRVFLIIYWVNCCRRTAWSHLLRSFRWSLRKTKLHSWCRRQSVLKAYGRLCSLNWRRYCVPVLLFLCSVMLKLFSSVFMLSCNVAHVPYELCKSRLWCYY